MSWKQPIDTEILFRNEFDAFDRAVWYEIILRARREKTSSIYYHGNKRIQLELDRGQMLFRVKQFAKEMGTNGHPFDRKRVRKSIDKLATLYSELDIETKPFGLVITVKNYDKLTDMGSERTSNQKNVKNDKNVKNEKKTDLYAPLFDFFWKTYPFRAGKKLGRQESFEAMKRYVKENEFEDFKKALNNYCKSKEAEKGYAKDPKRFFKNRDWNWHDWVEIDNDIGDFDSTTGEFT